LHQKLTTENQHVDQPPNFSSGHGLGRLGTNACQPPVNIINREIVRVGDTGFIVIAAEWGKHRIQD
jgi:hypothetical protein